jgi:electron transfer flavoprotein beta subunit
VSETSVPPLVVACMKLVERRAGIDPLSGAVLDDPLSAGPSPADEAALEFALRIAEAAGGDVVAISAGGASGDEMLRGALAAGAVRAIRVAALGDEPSALVAAALASAVRAELAAVATEAVPAGVLPVVVCCGDASLDRGSGSVPAFLAAELGAAQALGLVGVTARRGGGPEPGSVEPPGSVSLGLELEVERRLDRGRRERLLVRAPCVLSVEAVSARLRRASLAGALAVRSAVVAVHVFEAVAGIGFAVEVTGVQPFRPRTRIVPPPPAGLGPLGRIAELTGALHERPAARTLVLGPEEAADELLSTLAEWGELPDDLHSRLAASGELPHEPHSAAAPAPGAIADERPLAQLEVHDETEVS